MHLMSMRGLLIVHTLNSTFVNVVANYVNSNLTAVHCRGLLGTSSLFNLCMRRVKKEQGKQMKRL